MGKREISRSFKHRNANYHDYHDYYDFKPQPACPEIMKHRYKWAIPHKLGPPPIEEVEFADFFFWGGGEI